MVVRLTYFVHATTVDNERDIATGWQQGELSALGRGQALELARGLAAREFDVVFCSDLRRAIESARLMFGELYEIVEEARLRECDYGVLTGTLASGFKDRLAEYIETPFPKGESYGDVRRRIESFLDHLRNGYEGNHVAIVAHQAPQLALDVLLKGQTWQQAIDEDWRRAGAWQPGWKYVIE